MLKYHVIFLNRDEHVGTETLVRSICIQVYSQRQSTKHYSSYLLFSFGFLSNESPLLEKKKPLRFTLSCFSSAFPFEA